MAAEDPPDGGRDGSLRSDADCDPTRARVRRPLNKKKCYSLHNAAKYGDYDECVRLLDAGWTQEADDEGITPLQYAESNGHVKVCSLLVAMGAPPPRRRTIKEMMFLPNHRLEE